MVHSQFSADAVEPVFFKSKDFSSNRQESLRPYDVCVAVSNIVGQNNVEGAQNINGIWRVYTSSRESRVNLLMRGSLTVKGRQVNLYDKNPGLLYNQSDNIERVTVKDLPLSVANSEVEAYLLGKEIATVSAVKYSKARDDNGDLTNFKTGDRFVFVKGPVLPLLPRKDDIADFKCRIFHDGQFKPNCKVCNTVGHLNGDEDCPSKNTGPSVIPFHSHNNVLSNFYPCKIEVDNQVFNSVEHGYQYYQACAAGMHDLADEIKKAPHAGKAKGLSKRIPSEFRENWEKINTDKMKELITAKATQVPEFEQALFESEECVLAEVTPDKFWASGLSGETTRKTHPDSWPGLNTLGKLLMDIRDNFLLDQSGAENDEDVLNVESSTPDSLFQEEFPPLVSAGEHNKASTGKDILSKTNVTDTKATSSTSATSSQPAAKNPPKLIQKTLTETTRANAPTKESSNRQSKPEKRKPSKTPEKEKLNKLKKFISKK